MVTDRRQSWHRVFGRAANIRARAGRTREGQGDSAWKTHRAL